MRIKIKEFNIYIDEVVLIVAFFCLLFNSIRKYFENYFICYLFIIFHELAHMFTASIFGIKTTRLNICISGLNICLNERKRQGIKWIIIFLAGPISNVILASIFNSIPLVYNLNLVLAIINLVPIYPLDGYNILILILKMLRINEKTALKLINIIEIMVIIMLVIIGIYQFVFLKNLSIILMAFYIFIQGSSLRKKGTSALYQKYYKNITNFN